jgi:hypothetical protein
VGVVVTEYFFDAAAGDFKDVVILGEVIGTIGSTFVFSAPSDIFPLRDAFSCKGVFPEGVTGANDLELLGAGLEVGVDEVSFEDAVGVLDAVATGVLGGLVELVNGATKFSSVSRVLITRLTAGLSRTSLFGVDFASRYTYN